MHFYDVVNECHLAGLANAKYTMHPRLERATDICPRVLLIGISQNIPLSDLQGKSSEF